MAPKVDAVGIVETGVKALVVVIFLWFLGSDGLVRLQCMVHVDLPVV